MTDDEKMMALIAHPAVATGGLMRPDDGPDYFSIAVRTSSWFGVGVNKFRESVYVMLTTAGFAWAISGGEWRTLRLSVLLKGEPARFCSEYDALIEVLDAIHVMRVATE